MKSTNITNESDFNARCQLLIKVGQAAHKYGSTSARIERYLQSVSVSLGLKGAFKVTPTEMIFAFELGNNQPQRVHMSTLAFGGLDLDKLACVGELVDDVIKGSLSIASASEQLDVIANKKVPWGTLAALMAYVGIGAGIAVLFSGSWWDALFAALLSLVVFTMVQFSGRFFQRAADWLPLSTAFVAAVLASCAKFFIPELNIVLVILSAVIILVPGYGISLGIAELVVQKTASGLANFMNGIVYLFKQFIGAWLGAVVVASLLPIASTPNGTPVDTLWLWVFMPVIIAGLCIVFQTARRDFVWSSLSCLIAYSGILLGSAMLGNNLGNFLGTVLVVMYANIWARKTGRPNSIVLIPSIVLLVSGSIGFRGLASMAQGQTALGEQQIMQMGMVALTIVAGILIGNTIVKSEATL